MGFSRNITILTAILFSMVVVGLGQAPAVDTKKKADKHSKVQEIPDNIAAVGPVDATADPSATPATGGSDNGDSKAVDGEVLPYYQNYLKEYRLGPSDQISIEVFGQCPDYCRKSLTVPPNARISYPLIRDGVLVAGRTVEEIATEITAQLSEYIIDPKVTVTLDKAVATRYSILGKVGQPGVHVMDHKISVYEAVTNAGGVTREGDRKKVAIVRVVNGRLERKVLNLEEMEHGKTDLIYLQPGDQVFVPGKGLTMAKVFEVLASASSLRYMIPGLSAIPIPSIPYYSSGSSIPFIP